jgi:hypothetical protein
MEANRTAGVRALVADALDAIPKPYTEDVIDDVFHAIESRRDLLARYNKECERLGKMVVNTWGGYWTANFMDRIGERVVPARKSTLIGSYSKLDQPAPRPVKKLTEADAALQMSNYYRNNRASLPAWIRECREVILELLLAGVPVEQAYAQAISFRGGKTGHTTQ